MEKSECRFESKNLTNEELRAQNREDFMKRWFAIALSVGFATALARMPWIENQQIFLLDNPIDWIQANQIMRLFVAGVATILSWEGYLLSIRTKPLTDAARFYIDVGLVTLYLIILLTSASPYLWVGVHFLTFIIYIIWDFLSIKVHPDAYILNNADQYKTRRSVYAAVVRGSGDVYHGPIVTLIWPLYLTALAATYYVLFDRLEKGYPSVTALYTVLILYGLYSYRNSKSNKSSTVISRVQSVVVASIGAIFLASSLKCII